jgi:hypothetical protein
MRYGRLALALLSLLIGLFLVAPPASAQTGAACDLPESDAEALVILNALAPNKYIWDHTHLTVAIQAAPTVGEEYLQAIHEAIEAWDDVLHDCFGGLITLTDVTGSGPSAHRSADIVVHYVPHAGGVVFAGYAICGAMGCPNILVRSEFSPGQGITDYSADYLFYVTLHELGHALGLGHATNLRESMDLMGYEWIGTAPQPLFSQCDLDALAYVFSWALEGTSPPAPGRSTLEPTFDCSPA